MSVLEYFPHICTNQYPVYSDMHFFHPGFDFILISGGYSQQGQYLSRSSLIALDATNEQATSCSPPGNMKAIRAGPMIRMSGGIIVACGGEYPGGYRSRCEVYNSKQGNWTWDAKLSSRGAWAPSVQLDDNRIWIGRKLKITFPAPMWMAMHGETS